MLPLIISLVTGAVGGNAAGAVLKKFSLGTTGNSIAGILGGGLGGIILSKLGIEAGTSGFCGPCDWAHANPDPPGGNSNHQSFRQPGTQHGPCHLCWQMGVAAIMAVLGGTDRRSHLCWPDQQVSEQSSRSISRLIGTPNHKRRKHKALSIFLTEPFFVAAMPPTTVSPERFPLRSLRR